MTANDLVKRLTTAKNFSVGINGGREVPVLLSVEHIDTIIAALQAREDLVMVPRELVELSAKATQGELSHAALTGKAEDYGYVFHTGLGIQPPPRAHTQQDNAAFLVACWNFVRAMIAATSSEREG